MINKPAVCQTHDVTTQVKPDSSCLVTDVLCPVGHFSITIPSVIPPSNLFQKQNRAPIFFFMILVSLRFEASMFLLAWWLLDMRDVVVGSLTQKQTGKPSLWSLYPTSQFLGQKGFLAPPRPPFVLADLSRVCPRHLPELLRSLP